MSQNLNNYWKALENKRYLHKTFLMGSTGFDLRHNADYTAFGFEDSGKNGNFSTVIVYSPLIENPDIFNLGLVVKNPDTDKWDDLYYTGNDNAIKIFRTIAVTVDFFYRIHPNTKISFTGSDEARTKVYAKIIKARYKAISELYFIEATIGDDVIVPYDPAESDNYKRFILRQK